MRPARRLGVAAGSGTDVLSSTTNDFMASLQTKLDAQTADVQATIRNQTGIDTSDARVAQGTQSAGTLLTHGYNPDSEDDNANLIHAIAGGAALIPGPGVILAGAIEGLWLAGNAIACPITDAFASIGFGSPCGAPPCTSSGNWTAASILQMNAGALPSMPVGSFASLVVPALAMYAAQAANCKGGMPPSAIVDAVVALWNETHHGAPMPYLIPPLGTVGTSTGASAPVIIIHADSITGNTPAAKAGKDPYAYYGFGPVIDIIRDGVSGTNAAVQPGPWAPFPVAPPPPGMSYETPRIVDLNSGPFVPADSGLKLGPAAAAGLTVATGGLVGGLAYAWATGKTAEAVFGTAWSQLAGLFKSGAGAVERGVRIPIGASERLRRRRRR